MGVIMSVSILVGALNIVLAAVLFVVYRGVYSRTRAPFSFALLLVALAFLAQNVLVVYAFVTMMSLVPSALDPYLFGIGVFEAMGLGAMLWTATR